MHHLKEGRKKPGQDGSAGKALPCKPNNLSSILEHTHMWKDLSDFLKVSSDLHVHAVATPHSPTHTAHTCTTIINLNKTLTTKQKKKLIFATWVAVNFPTVFSMDSWSFTVG